MDVGLQVPHLELEDGPPVPGRVQVAVEALVELPVLADEDHALANVDVLDVGHRLVLRRLWVSRSGY